MGDFKRPLAVRSYTRGSRSSKTAEADDSNGPRDCNRTPNRRQSDIGHYRSPRTTRSRFDSFDSAENKHSEFTRNERYCSDGHQGSLRSPLRLENQTQRSSRRRESLPNEERYSNRQPGSFTGPTRNRRFPIRHRDSSRELRSSRRYSEEGRESNSSKASSSKQKEKQNPSPAWQAESLLDFPPLSTSDGPTDWGSRVEQEELEHEMREAERLKGQQSKEESCASLDQSFEKKSDFTPKRWYTRAELATEEVKQVMQRRQKQIEYGKRTSCYQNYIQAVPKISRTRVHPSTPDKNVNYSRRGWDMIIRIWRKKLHAWDPDQQGKETAAMEGSDADELATSLLDDSLTCADLDGGQMDSADA